MLKRFIYDTMSTLKVKRLYDTAKLPTQGTVGSAGWDLYSSVFGTVPPWSRLLVATGISITVPPGTYGRVAPRSGLAVKNGIDVGAGVVDRSYTGEVAVVLFNLSDEPFTFKTGERIAQLILEKIDDQATLEEVSELAPTERGNGGFGSTGK